MRDDPVTRQMLVGFEQAALTNARQIETMMGGNVSPVMLAMMGAFLLARSQYQMHCCVCGNCEHHETDVDAFKVAAREMLERSLNAARLEFTGTKGSA